MKVFKFLLGLVVLGAIAACGALYLLRAPYGPSSETFVEIPPGTGSAAIGARLQAAGIVRSKYLFEAMRFRKPGVLRAGEYRFDHPATPGEVYARIARGDVYTIAVVVPEGYNMYDISQAVEKAGLCTAASFLAAAHRDTGLIADLSPHAMSLEGYLFPDTYRFNRHATADQIVAAMVKRFRRAAAILHWGSSTPGQRRASIVTLASLIEKEVRVDAERPLVAGVFLNRMAKGMTLATDPTVIYAAYVDGRWQGPGPKIVIYRSDLDSPSPYNTYRHAGLPPGPICNPGIASLQAALHPAETDYLYFVADAAGHSRFASDLKEHNQNVQAYRKATAKP